LLNSAFDLVEKRAAFELICYVNADIILPSDFLDAVRQVSEAHRRFLMVGRGWDLDVSKELLVENQDWGANLRRLVTQAGTVRPLDAIDYFVFPCDTIGPLPPFAVGRPKWDNWMVYRARSRRIPVVDASASTLVIHQKHGYGHVKQATGDGWEGPEAERNRALAKRSRVLVKVPARTFFTLGDATHLLTPSGLVGAPGVAGLKGRVRAELRVASATVPGYLALRPLQRLRRIVAIRTRLGRLRRS
jgi:hypothetical protein